MNFLIALLPSRCFHRAASIALLPSRCFHRAASIALLPSRCFHRAASIALAGLGLTVLAAIPARAGGPNIVTNPSFETDTFAGWTATLAPSGSSLTIESANGLLAHSGSYAADFAGAGSVDDILSQPLSTVAGDTYSISFWVSNLGGPQNDFKASFGDTQLLDIENASSFVYTQYSFTETAMGPSTLLTFAGRQFSSAFVLDDISVNDLGPNPVPEASTTVSLGLLLALGWGGVVVAARRKKSVA